MSDTEQTIKILAIESSCDETAAAVVVNGRDMRSNVISSQIALHTCLLYTSIGLYASVLGYAIHQYGSIDGFLKAYSDMQGIDYNELMKQFIAK